MTQSGFESLLIDVLAKTFDNFETLESVEQLTAGASQETYRIVYSSPNGEIAIALRRAPIHQRAINELSGIGLDTEARLFRLAYQQGVPSPKIYYELVPEDHLGPGYLMNWIEGETMGHKIIRSAELKEIRPHLAQQCGKTLGDIHNIDWQAAGLDCALEVQSPTHTIDSVYEIYRKLNAPYPMIDFTYRWLKEHMPTTDRQTLVHGDFRNGNLVVDKAGLQAVLDWEIAHIGDPVQDLGWICVNSWRFGNADFPVGGFGQIEELLEGYESVTGVKVDRAHLDYWIAFGSFWWSISTLAMTLTWRSGETPSLERPVIGRRSSEAQMDCVNLIIPGPYTLPTSKTPAQSDTQLPAPAELLTGAIDFLKEVSGNMGSRSKFLAKVASNSLGIAQREFQIGAQLDKEEASRIAALLNLDSDDVHELRWGLVHTLRDGLALETPLLAEHLRQTVAGRLSIDQPNYSALDYQRNEV